MDVCRTIRAYTGAPLVAGFYNPEDLADGLVLQNACWDSCAAQSLWYWYLVLQYWCTEHPYAIATCTPTLHISVTCILHLTTCMSKHDWKCTVKLESTTGLQVMNHRQRQVACEKEQAETPERSRQRRARHKKSFAFVSYQLSVRQHINDAAQVHWEQIVSFAHVSNNHQ